MRAPRTSRAIAILACSLLGGCIAPHFAAYDASAFARPSIAEGVRVDGRALVLTREADDAFVYRGRPESFMAYGIALEFPLGRIVREAAVRAAGDLFTDGADAANACAALERYRAVIEPRLMSFRYRHHWTGTELRVSVRVARLDAGGRGVFDRTYDSGWVAQEAPFLWRPGPRRYDGIVRSAHVEVQRLMLRAVADATAELEMDR